ncbi:alveolin domain containing intermediate filament IMC4, putative [Babesia ovis]|uniref:Alveolin domain containing intermediate filament IMC4, putative n=1 Tax=Babesia ovis TaxID=5869 RepID=A0A9W5TF98_BABOV|nr:alveolin domain containing intermediate filament IMC4, putative [Babesia ovis]
MTLLKEDQSITGKGNINPSAYQNKGQSYLMPENVNMMPTPELTSYMQPNSLGPNFMQQTVLKKAKSKFPANLCCCCYGEQETVPVETNLVTDPNRSIVLQPIRRERIVEVMKEEIQERVINVPQIQYVDKYVEVTKPVFKYKIKEVKRPVVVEKIKRVPKIVEEEKIIEVPEIRYVEKEVDVPHIVKKEKIVEVPLPIVRERRIPVLRLRKDEKYQEVENINYDEFETNIISMRQGPEAPNNTPIKPQLEEHGNRTPKQDIVGSISKDDRDNKYESEKKDPEGGYKSGGTMDLVPNTHGRKYDYIRDQHDKVERSVNHVEPQKRMNEINDRQISNHYKIQTPPAEHNDVAFNQVLASENENDNGPMVTEIISVRGIGNKQVPSSRGYRGSQYNMDGLVVEVEEDYENISAQEDCDLVSIYPNINALSLNSVPRDGKNKKQDGTDQEATNVNSGRGRSIEDDKNSDSNEGVTHVRITK